MTLKNFFNKCVLWCPLPVIFIWNVKAIIALIKEGVWAKSMVDGLFYRQPMHSMTIVVSTLLYFSLLAYFYANLEPSVKVGSSIALILFGLTFYEAWWHLGCGGDYPRCIPTIWFLYSAIMGVCVVYLDIKYDIIDLSSIRVLIVTLLFGIFIIGMGIIMKNGFYTKFYLYERGLGPNPHDLFMFINVIIGRTLWLPLVKKVRRWR